MAGQPRRLRALAFKLYGQPPREDAPTSERLHYVRRIYFRLLPFALLVWPWAIIWVSETWVFVVLGVGALVSLQGIASLSLRIRREQRREKGRP